MRHADNEKWETTHYGENGIIKIKKTSERSEKRKLTNNWYYWKRTLSNKWR